MPPLVFRCDGDDSIGAGHVGRCLRIARAFREHGDEVVFAGSYGGAAAALLHREGARVVAPGDGPAGVPHEAAAAFVDHYDIAGDALEALNERIPVGVMLDDRDAPRVTAALAYHLDAEERIGVPDGTTPLLGPRYAPLRPDAPSARRERTELRRALVSLGGGAHGAPVLEAVADALKDVPELFVAGELPRLEPRPGLEQHFEPGGLLDRIRWADVAVSGAGTTPYELACAGVPAIVVVLADNQAPVAAAFERAGLAIALDARDQLDRGALTEAVEKLADKDRRRAMAEAGPRLIDGRGAERCRAALSAAFGPLG